jgi:hypothetical protein
MSALADLSPSPSLSPSLSDAESDPSEDTDSDVAESTDDPDDSSSDSADSDDDSDVSETADSSTCRTGDYVPSFNGWIKRMPGIRPPSMNRWPIAPTRTPHVGRMALVSRAGDRADLQAAMPNNVA